MKDRAQRVLIIAARPEDEARVFGATIATLVQRGTELIVLSCSSSPASDDTDASVREILGITSHHVLRVDDGAQFSTLTSRDLAADIAEAIGSLKPDVVLTYALTSSGSEREEEAQFVHEASAYAAELAGIPLYTSSIVPVDRGVAVSSATAIAFKRRAFEIYGDEVPVGESILTPAEYLRRLRRIELVVGERSRAERAVLAIASTVIGAFVGLVLTAIHQSTITLFGASIPWGIIVALALTTALLLGLRLIYDTRTGSGFASLGVLLMSAILATTTPGGTILIPANVSGYIWAFAPVLIVLIIVGWPRVNRQASVASRDNIEEISLVKGADIS